MADPNAYVFSHRDATASAPIMMTAVWQPTGNLRWRTHIAAGSDTTVLEQEWACMNNGARRWEPIPRYEPIDGQG